MPNVIRARLSAPRSWTTDPVTVTRAQVVAAAGTPDLLEAAKKLEARFVADAGSACADGQLSMAELQQLSTDAIIAAAAQGLVHGGQSVTFSTNVVVNTDGSAWFAGALNKAPMPTFNGMLAGLSPQDQIAKQQEFAPYRKVGLGNPYYVLASGDNLSSVAERLVQQAYAGATARAASAAELPWFKTGTLGDGRRLNVADENAYLKPVGGFDKYKASDRFRLRVADFYRPQLAAGIPSVVSMLGQLNELPNVDCVIADGVLKLPGRADIEKALGL